MSTESVQERIVKALAEKSPLQAGELKNACGKMAESTFYKHCGKLVKERRILNKSVGRAVFYVLPEDAWKLKHLVENRGALESHVIRGARQILDELMTIDLSDPRVANRTAYWRSGMLVQAVERLRKTNRELPRFDHPDYEEYADPDEPDMTNMVGWYNYWLDVLEALKAF